MLKPRKIPTREQMLQQMAGLCAKCEQCEHDLREKMRKKGLPGADADAVIDFLYDHNFLNESRFAHAYASDKHRFNGWGRIKIRMMLGMKRVSRDCIDDALAALDEKEYMEILQTLVNAKARDLDLSDAKDRAKLLRSLYGRGFEPALIVKAMRRSGED